MNIKQLILTFTFLLVVGNIHAGEGVETDMSSGSSPNDMYVTEVEATENQSYSTDFTLQEDVKPVYIDSLDVADEWKRKMYIKTNALGWGLLITNIALEVDIDKHWTFAIPVYFSGWDYFSPTVKFRTLSFYPEIRYHFKEDKGWFVGAHFGLSYFNIATDGEYRLQDRDGDTPAIGGGLAVGYRMPVTKNKRWQMEFSVGAGIYDVHYDRFRNKVNGFLVDTKDKLYIGPDQAAVTISYNFDLCKGGEKK